MAILYGEVDGKVVYPPSMEGKKQSIEELEKIPCSTLDGDSFYCVAELPESFAWFFVSGTYYVNRLRLDEFKEYLADNARWIKQGYIDNI